jgi:pyruvate/2-oxoglutarate dehydrogenase complex dihydrolipoamide dehydrogenase (E3) component
MVGVEAADLLRTLPGVKIQVLELQATAANGMARNNKFELLERLAASGVSLVTQCRILGVERGHLQVQVGKGAPSQLPIGDALIFATGPKPSLDVLAAVQATGLPFERIGDCSVPGDFLSALRDGWMVGLRIDAQPSVRNGGYTSGVHARPVAGVLA